MNTPAIDIQNLVVRYGAHLILENLTFRLEPGFFLAIVGPNGAGKSTLLKVLLGLVAPNSGEVRILGQRPDRAEPGLVGYIPQIKTSDRNFPALALELVASGLTRRWPGVLTSDVKRKSMAALERIGAGELAQRPLNRLSGGELQRVFFARCLVNHPRVVMLDEPATGIDAVGEADMYHLLEEYQEHEGATVVMVTHDLNAVCHLCTRILVLNRRQIGFGPPEEAMNDHNMRLAFGHQGHSHAMVFKSGNP